MARSCLTGAGGGEDAAAMSLETAPVDSPARAPRSEGAELAIGMALGLVAAAVASWFRPPGLVAVLVVLVVLAVRRSRQAWAGAMVGGAIPMAALGFWGSAPVLSVVAVALLAAGLATALLARADAVPPRLGTAAVAAVGVLAGVFAGFVLLSSLFLIGYLPLVIVLCAAVYAGRRRVLPWLVLGASVMPWFIAVSNWGGPGTKCGSDADSQWCSELADPRPFLLAAVALTLVGAAALVLATTAGRRAAGAR